MPSAARVPVWSCTAHISMANRDYIRIEVSHQPGCSIASPTDFPFHGELGAPNFQLIQQWPQVFFRDYNGGSANVSGSLGS